MSYIIKRGKCTSILDFATSFDLHVQEFSIINAPPLEEIEPRECSICNETTNIESLFDSCHTCCSKFCKEVRIVY